MIDKNVWFVSVPDDWGHLEPWTMCPTCRGSRWTCWVAVGARWVQARPTPASIDDDALFAARLDQHAHLLWTCSHCDEVIS